MLRRDVSNSPFFIGGRRLGRTSVQEELERHLVPLLRADRAKFLCAGALRPSRSASSYVDTGPYNHVPGLMHFIAWVWKPSSRGSHKNTASAASAPAPPSITLQGALPG